MFLLVLQAIGLSVESWRPRLETNLARRCGVHRQPTIGVGSEHRRREYHARTQREPRAERDLTHGEAALTEVPVLHGANSITASRASGLLPEVGSGSIGP